MPLPDKALNVPPETVISPIKKSVEDSLSVNVIVAVSPTSNEAELVVIAIVGVIVFTVIVTVLFASAPSILKVPIELLNLLLATLITPLVVLLTVGVNTEV